MRIVERMILQIPLDNLEDIERGIQLARTNGAPADAEVIRDPQGRFIKIAWGKDRSNA